MSPLSFLMHPKRTLISNIGLLTLLAGCFSLAWLDGVDARARDSQERPLVLASGDVDEDGIPDLVCGYALAHGGMLAVYRGNVDSIYPNTPEARSRRRGTEPTRPFLSPRRTLDLPVAPAFIRVEDFDNDGHLDLVVREQSGNTSHLVKGNGRGDFGASQQITQDDGTTSDGILSRAGVPAKAGTTYPTLRMRLNSDAVDDLVYFRGGQSEPEFILSAPAATFTVTHTFDGGPGSLRQAINDANTSAGADAIVFNIVGTGVQTIALSSPLPVVSEAVTIDATTQPGFADTPLIELNGDTLIGEGIQVNNGGTVVRGFVINRFYGNGIFLFRGSRNIIEGNFIGTDVSGTFSRGNSGSGILVSDSSNNTIGGTTALARNVVSGNFLQGVTLGPALDSPSPDPTLTIRNLIQGNYIGTDVTGNAAIGNNLAGVFVLIASRNEIGGATAGARNLISGNNGIGVLISTTGRLADSTPTSGPANDNIVQGNFIGTNATGSAAVGNFGDGIALRGASKSIIGGTSPLTGNVISANGAAFTASFCIAASGVSISGDSATDNLIQGNFIGTDSTGSADLGNRFDGISIGFVRPSCAPPISTNILSTNTISGNTVGGTVAGAGNIIAFNGSVDGNGISVVSPSASNPSVANPILRNSIHSNYRLGIDLARDGVTANDPGDADTGPNDLLNYPVLTSAASSPQGITVQGSIESVPNTALRIEFFSDSECDPSGNGEGKTFLGESAVVTDANGSARIQAELATPVLPGHFITATATDSQGNSSEFSKCAQVRTQVSDVAITKTASPNPVIVNGSLTYLLQVTNSGPDSAAGVVVTDALPVGVNLLSVSPANVCTGPPVNSNGTVTCMFSSVAAGASIPITIVARPTSSSGGTISNTASISSITSDPVLTNNTASALVQVDPSADLAITKSVSPNPVTINSSLTYTLAVTNNGPDAASGVIVTDVLPGGVNFVAVTPSNICTGPPVNTNGTVTCMISSLGASASVAITIVTTPTISAGNAVTNTAHVSSNTSDPVLINNTATAVVQVNPSADLTLTKSASPNPVNTNSSLTYLLQLTNSGPNTASAVVVTDVLPGGVNFLSVSPANICSGPPVNTSGTVTCMISSFASGASLPITIVTSPTSSSGSSITNTASVSSNTSDPVLTNNTATAVIQVNPSADLAITTTAPGPITAPDGSINLPGPGDIVTFSIQAINNGPAPALDVAMSTSVPSNTTFQSLSVPPGWACSTPGFGGSGAIRCTILSAMAGTTGNFQLGVRLDDTVIDGTTVTATAEISSVSPDPVPANNSSAANVSVGRALAVINPASLDFGTSTAIGPLDPNASSRTFVITNSGTSLLRYTLTSLLRRGPDVDNLRITSPDDRSAFQVRLTQPGQPEVAAPFGQVLTLGAGRQQQFRIVFNARIPILAGRFNGLAANQAMPDTVMSRLTISTSTLNTLMIDLTGRIATPAKLVHPLDPTRPALVTLNRAGATLTVEVSVYDSNLDLSSVRYEFLDASGELVSDPVDVSVATAIRQSQLARGQGFRIEQRFDVSGEADIARVRVTIVDEAFDTAESGPPGAAPAAFASVSAASFREFGLAPESIIAGFGADLARTELHAGYPLPTTLGGISVRIKDGAGMEWEAPLFFVSPNQINYQLPSGISPGAATVIVVNQEGELALDVLRVTGTYPGLFTANSDVNGVAAALMLRQTIDGRQSYEPVAMFDETQGRYVAVPLVAGPDSDRLFMVFFGTGIRHRNSDAAVRVLIGETEVPVLYAGLQGVFAGLDQVNVELLPGLFGRGETGVTLIVDGRESNRVSINLGGPGKIEDSPEALPPIVRVSKKAGISLPSVRLRLRSERTIQ